MKINRLCRGCFHELPEGKRICPNCGFDLNRYEQQRKAEILPTGTILHGSYITGKCLGQGGFGITYIGYHEELETVVAIKELFPKGVVSRDTRGSGDAFTVNLTGYDMQESYKKALDSFMREARTLAKLEVPGVVKVTDCFRENETAYIVMKYIEGQSLKEYQKTLGGPMREDDVLTLLHPVITSLKELHKKGIIHRDISPDNLMIGKDGKVMLVDFGAARSVSTSIEKAGRSLTVILKPGYAPMEQYSSKGLQGPWTDVYALCSTMFRLMTGTVPNQPVDRSTDPDDENSLKKLLYTNGVSKHIVNVLVKGMSLQPASRYQSMQDLEDALYIESTEDFNIFEQTEESDGRTITEALASNQPPEKDDGATEELLTKKNNHVVERNLFDNDDGLVDMKLPKPRKLPWVIGSIGLILVSCVVLVMVIWKNKIPSPQPFTEGTTKIEESESQSNIESESQSESEHLAADSISNEVLYTEFGTYEQDNDTSNGPEVIEWIVLDVKGDQALVISKDALDVKVYNDEFSGVTWETCSLRSWLNGEFYENAFSEEEQSKINTTHVEAENNNEYGTYTGNDTYDKVFLLSNFEAKALFANDEARKCYPTEYAIGHKAYVDDGLDDPNDIGRCWWWLRSSGDDGRSAVDVGSDGRINDTGSNVVFEHFCVRPALWINQASIFVYSD